MIPSTVAHEVTRALHDFLATGFGPSNPALATVLDDFLAQPENLVKGPYLSIALPPKLAPEGGEPFPEIPLGFTPYRHQRIAHQRLDSAAPHGGRSTIVATGTGSGKTECFLWPILDHCRRHAGEEGVKAILVYPMNALAFDQARRIAKVIHGNPALRGKVSAGLYVGERERLPHTTMGPEHLVTDREALRERPPHILLTNYKMLDFLMIRPPDARLWRHNQAGALRYLVVDELHTFDGPQGTDLACLIRRLKDRLQVPRRGLVCVGTSATVGGEENRAELRKYVADLFGQPFDEGAILTEERQSIDDVLGSAIIQRHLSPRPSLAETTDPARYPNAETYLKAQHQLFFGTAIKGDWHANGWRIALAAKLREHLMFVNLLRTVAEGPLPFVDVVARMRASLPLSAEPAQAQREAVGLLNALCALIAAAREEDGAGGVKPFLRVGLHLWVRELRRMVCRVALPDGKESPPETEAEQPAEGRERNASPAPLLRHSDDLDPEGSPLHLPLVQCRECRVTGWGAVQRSATSKASRDLREFYNRFFSRDMDVRFYFPTQSAEVPPGIAGAAQSLCGACGHLHAGHNVSACTECGETAIVPVFAPESTTRRGNRTVLSRNCPFCHASEALIIVGARASSLLSVVLGQAFASKHNDDAGGSGLDTRENAGAQKVIAFSDNVQDAAHRAGFFSARTWQNSVRAAIAQVIAQKDGIVLSDLQREVPRWWRSEHGGGFTPERFIAEFIAPDRQWFAEFRELQERGRLASDALERLERLVATRLEWETLAELGYRSTIGRTLERTRTAAVGMDRAALLQASEAATQRLREHFEPFRELPANTAQALLLGVLRRMKDRGAFDSPLTAAYVAHGGNPYGTLSRNRALQDFGRRSALPVFPALRPGRESGLEALAGRSRGAKSWYQKWVEKVLSPFDPLAATEYAADVLETLLAALVDSGLVVELDAGSTTAYGLNPARFHATLRTAELHGASTARPLVVAADEADLWQGVPCLDLATQDSYQAPAPAASTWFGQLYRQAAIRRIVAAEHTALVGRDERASLQERFAAPQPQPWEPNVLSATPTLELGVDIGELSAVVLCQVPPAPENYVQRIGRAGRRDGNALTVTVATGQPHDLYYYAEPLDMLARGVEPPGIFLNASAVLERQLTAFCLDSWVASGIDEGAVPEKMRAVYESVAAGRAGSSRSKLERARQGARFPYPFFDYVQRHSEDLLERFLQAFEELSESSRDYLAKFLQGDEDGYPKLVARLLNRLTDVNKERKSLRTEAQTLRRRIAALEKGPQDEATKGEIEELDAERRALDAIRRHINNRDVFAFLTDEGLIPNYAFPQQGVTLRSVIYRQPREEERDERQPLYEYERPAEAALGELAPENEFYASGRHVRVSRVDTRVSPVETWRLCPSCAFCENVEQTGDAHTLCPRCGDPMWGDEGQRRHMLPLRLVHANTADRRSRILDDKDDREPLFYTRHLVVDFQPSAIETAYAIAKPEAPFGFEYIRSATFREMNFGRVDDLGRPTRFAGRETPRSGFRVCRECGTVQPRGAGEDAEKAEHTRFCKFARSAAPGEGIVECLYLYREFDSEALRLLLPIAHLASERHVASFVAALELGLRQRFGGRLPHLRAMTGDNALPGDNDGRRYLILYDTVPGGTGYLKDLLAKPQNLLDVLQASYTALQNCECGRSAGADPQQDGCYRCVYAYRRSRDMEHTSRSTAMALLAKILEHAEDLEAVEGLAKVDVNALVESELEARFLEALRRAEVDGEKARVRHDLVAGKPGYVLKIGNASWLVEPQADLAQADGVAVPSRPDFLLRPVRGDATPVAVFMDGFEYHRDTTAEDSRKRMALARAGFQVWSLTWQDLEVAFGGAAEAGMLLDAQNPQMAKLQCKLDKLKGTTSLRRQLREPALFLLLRWLRESGEPSTAETSGQRWRNAIFTTLLGLFDRQRMRKRELRERFENATGPLPGQLAEALADMDDPAFGGTGAWLKDAGGFADLFLALPLAAIEPPDPAQLIAVAHLRDTEANRRNPNYRPAWNGVLRLFNLLQFLPSGWWITREGVKSNRYPDYAPTAEAPRQAAASTASAEWEAAMELAAPELHEAMKQWAASGLTAPQVGYELADGAGRVLAEAELAWPECKVAVMHGEEADAVAFDEAGWQVYSASEGGLVRSVVDDLVGHPKSPL